MKNPLKNVAFAAGLLSVSLLTSSCGRIAKFFAKAAAEEAAIETGKEVYHEVNRRSDWQSGVDHPTVKGAVSADRYQRWIPKTGWSWEDTKTTEPRKLK